MADEIALPPVVLHHIEVNRLDTALITGGWSWQIKRGEDTVANGIWYSTKQECLDSLFGLFFGSYDMSFLEMHYDWQDGADIPDLTSAPMASIDADFGGGGEVAGD